MMTYREFQYYFKDVQVALMLDSYQSYWYDKEDDDQTNNYYIGTMAASLNTMEWMVSPYHYKFFTSTPQTSTATLPAFNTPNTGYIFIIVESYYYGMIPYSCYTASSYPESIVKISLGDGTPTTYTKTSNNVVPIMITTPPAANNNYKV